MQILKNKNLPKGITIRKAAKLLKISRSTLYYKPRKESSCNQELMELIEKNYLKDPTMGFRRMKARLERLTGKRINHKRVRRLMRKMGLKGIVPSPRTTKTTKTHYNNLLKTTSASYPNKIWCADITYVRTKGGFAYGVAIMDLYSRKVLSFKLSNTLDESFCLEAAEEALRKYGAPCIIHTDRGKQFTGKRFTKLFERAGSRISTGEFGFKDNILMERFWRSYKWECVYLRERMGLKELKETTRDWVRYYNSDRPHQSLGYKSPNEVYYGYRVAV